MVICTSMSVQMNFRMDILFGTLAVKTSHMKSVYHWPKTVTTLNIGCEILTATG